jgi:predicted metalloprotease
VRSARIVSLVAVLTAAASLLTGCWQVPLDPGGGGKDPRGGLGRGGATPSSGQVDETVRTALKDVERYWTATFPKLTGGRSFTPLKGGYHAYTRRRPPPACGSERVEYQPNAFYCPAGDFIAWDAEELVPRLYADYGPLLVAVVMAHEFGHAVQTRLNVPSQPTIVVEQQADCFAGSWVADVQAGNSTSFDKAQPDKLDSTIAGILLLRDQPGTSALAPQAHGNAFDRVRAFQEGFEQTATRCATYQAGNLPVTEIPFTSLADAATGGDLPYREALNSLSDDVQEYWTRTFPQLTGRAWEPLRVIVFDPAKAPACDRQTRSREQATGAAYYCEPDRYVAIDGDQLAPALYERIGDNALGMLLADLFAQAAQDRRGRPTQGRDAQLAIDCLAGSWTFDVLRTIPGQGIRLSPGDLDEAVAALLVFGRAADSSGASAFDRIGAFRNGVLNGLPKCG